ncbi:hypothetical protein ANN_16116 [Periplaneta americana]|uniref:Uncharacterized protein n=1 Tax=Periplaneta americana TaxID=6978 RepID=A0ABQ8SIV0_PERAM|nr:hypothetical protein ANN_16116 [Periplaneta americana]
METSVNGWSPLMSQDGLYKHEALRNIRHHAVRSMLAEALKEVGFTVHQEVQGLATRKYHIHEGNGNVIKMITGWDEEEMAGVNLHIEMNSKT